MASRLSSLLPFLAGTQILAVSAQMKSVDDLVTLHDRHQVSVITSRRFNQAAMLDWIDHLGPISGLRREAIGTSAEGRPITLFSYGTGRINVLGWSQMHGDEPTATMALIDLLSIFRHAPDHPVVANIRDHLTLLLIPMINPDGAERFQRRTGQGIDMNRDALRLVTPEARLLKNIRERFLPEFAFNLHDQDPRYTVGQSTVVAAISLLAPATDEAKSDDRVRRKAKQLTVRIIEALGGLVGGHMTRYDDTFEPRAFGDNVQQWGTSTILIESGGWQGDPEKMHLRKANAVALLAAFRSIATRDFEDSDTGLYDALPLNGKNMYDIIARGGTFKASPAVSSVQADIGINFEEQADSAGNPLQLARIVDIGDLSTMAAFAEFDCRGAEFDTSEVRLQMTMPKDQIVDLLERKRAR